MRDLGVLVQISMSHYDSHRAIMLAKNLVFHVQTKHIALKYHFIQDVLEDKHMDLVKVHTM